MRKVNKKLYFKGLLKCFVGYSLSLIPPAIFTSGLFSWIIGGSDDKQFISAVITVIGMGLLSFEMCQLYDAGNPLVISGKKDIENSVE